MHAVGYFRISLVCNYGRSYLGGLVLESEGTKHSLFQQVVFRGLKKGSKVYQISVINLRNPSKNLYI